MPKDLNDFPVELVLEQVVLKVNYKEAYRLMNCGFWDYSMDDMELFYQEVEKVYNADTRLGKECRRWYTNWSSLAMYTLGACIVESRKSFLR